MEASTPIYVIDTHPLVWYFEDSPRLSSAAKRAFEQIELGNALGVIPKLRKMNIYRNQALSHASGKNGFIS